MSYKVNEEITKLKDNDFLMFRYCQDCSPFVFMLLSEYWPYSSSSLHFSLHGLLSIRDELRADEMHSAAVLSTKMRNSSQMATVKRAMHKYFLMITFQSFCSPQL